MPSVLSRELCPQLPRLALNDTLESEPNDSHGIRPSSHLEGALHEDHADQSGYASNVLGQLLRAGSIRADRHTETEFWSEFRLRKLLTRSHVKQAFQSSKLRRLNLTGSVDNIMKNYFKILAILALMEKLKYIKAFMDNQICDQDLPLVKCTSGNLVSCNIARRTAPGQALICLNKWSIDQRNMFLSWQYCVSPPVLAMGQDTRSAKHENFPPQIVMPWTSTLKQKEEGGYSQVFEVEVHPDCHDFRKVLESLSIQGENKFAVKKLTKGEKQDATDVRLKFENEKRMLERFRGHPHLVTLLMSWTLKEEYYFLFPFAESDLDRYWELETNWIAVSSSVTHDRHESICWISKQIYKMVEALEHIHNLDKSLSADKRFGRHGDLKPENVLWYRSTKDPRGFFVIADMGLAACNSEQSRSGIPSNTVARTPNYRSPECDLEDGKISRSYDIWTLGCLLLEMVCWIIGGPTSRNTFANERMSTYVTGSLSDIFFDVEEKDDGTGHVMFVKRSVEKKFSDLHGDPLCTEFLHELLDLIEKDMLVVLCKENRRVRDRIASKELLNKIRSIHTKVEGSQPYCLEPQPEPRDPIHGIPVNAILNQAYLGPAKHNRLKIYSGASRAALTAEEY